MSGKVTSSRFISTIENLHQCKTQLARKSKVGQSDRVSEGYIPNIAANMLIITNNKK